MSKEPVDKMIAEGLREVGVLIIVFANLDKIVAGGISVLWTLMALTSGGIFFALGVLIERRRSDE